MKTNNLVLTGSARLFRGGSRSGRLTAVICTLALACFGLAPAARAQKKGKGGSGGGGGGGGSTSSNIPVTSVVNDTGVVADGTNYRVQSDGVSFYYSNGVDGVSSNLQEGRKCGSLCGDWVLDTTASTTRTVLVDLRDPLPGTTSTPFSYAVLPTRIIVKCSQAQSGSFPGMSLDQTLSCPMFVRFYTPDGNSYRLVMSSGPNAGYDLPETNNARVTCNAVSSGACTAWTVVPIQQPNSGPVENIARLEQVTKRSFVNLGDFYVTFQINVTNP